MPLILLENPQFIADIYYRHYEYIDYCPTKLSDFFKEFTLTHPLADLRSFIARSEDLPISNLEQLSRDEDYVVRKSVAKNKNTPESILEQLSQDENSDVRISVAT
ncbi:HEAT repeat domain-containing protein, partial [Anaplasma marginale]|uniref:HEAT repeat domain-containing protein n=1 Tax=Anaplasma marginale TaxID=770 RepID=UPI0011456229